MRSLPVFPLALALLPLSTSLRCSRQPETWDGEGTPSPLQLDQSCPSHHKYCSIMKLTDKAHPHRRGHELGCGPYCPKEECQAPFNMVGTFMVEMCCCADDNCNAPAAKTSATLPATSAPSTDAPALLRSSGAEPRSDNVGSQNDKPVPLVLLPLAAVAAMIAARN